MNQEFFKLEVSSMNWLNKDEPQFDLCAHGEVIVQIGEELLVGPESGNGWTVSTTALLLLRTLERDHTNDFPVGDQIVPCCGYFFVFEEGMEEVYIGSCPTGINWELKHIDGMISLETPDKTKGNLPFDLYKSQVLTFVDKVESFYKVNEPKVLDIDEFDRNGYKQFWKEWYEKRSKWQY